MMVKVPQCMIGFGAFLAACGFAGWAAAGFTAKAKTAILSGSVSGALMIAAGWLAGRSTPGLRRAGVILGIAAAALLAAAFTWRASVAWALHARGEPKLYVAILLTAMGAGAYLVLAVQIYTANRAARLATGAGFPLDA